MADIQSPLNPQYDGPVAMADQIGRPGGARVETSLIAVEAAAPVAAGEQAYEARLNVFVANGGVTQVRAALTDETVCGITIPAGSTGTTSQLAPAIDIPAQFAARFAGSVLTLSAVYTHTPGFLADKAISAAPAQVTYRDGTAPGDVGIVLSAADVAADRYQRSVAVTLTANMASIAPWMQILASTSTANTHTISLTSLTMRCTSVPADATYTVSDVNAWLAGYQSKRAEIGPVFPLLTFAQNLANGATARAVGGRNVGVTIPAGQTGLATDTYADLTVGSGWAGSLGGATPWVYVLVNHSAAFDRPLVLRAYRNQTTQLPLINARVIQLSPTQRLYIARVNASTGALAGTETNLRAHMRILGAGAAAAAAAQYYEIADVTWGVSSSGSVAVAGDEMAARIRDARMRDAIATGDAALQTSIAGNSANIANLLASLTTTFANQGEIVRTDLYGPGAYNRWFFGGSVGVEIASGQSISHLGILLTTYADSATRQVRITVMLRDLALTSTALNAAGQQAGDIVYPPITSNLVDLGLTPGASQVSALVHIPHGLVLLAALAGKRVYYFIEGLDASGAYSALGVGFTSAASGTVDQGKRGYFGSTGLANSIPSPNQIAWRAELGSLASSTDIAKAIGAGTTLPADFLLPDKLWLTEGQTIPFNWTAMSSVRIEQSAFDASITSVKYRPPGPVDTPPGSSLCKMSSGPLEIDPARVGSAVTFSLHRRGSAERGVRKVIPAVVTSWKKAGSPVLALFGDSLAAQYKVAALKQELVARGMDPIFLGSVSTTVFNGEGGSTLRGEGRGGKPFAAWLNELPYDPANMNTMRPCVGADAITREAYGNLPNNSATPSVDTRERRTPWLEVSSGAGSYNGLRFSFAQGLTFLGWQTPTHTVWSVGANDSYQRGEAAMLATIAAGIPIIVARIREVSSTTRIAFISDGLGQGRTADDYALHYKMMKAQAAAVRALGDDKVAYIPLGLHEDPLAFGALTVVSTDSTGMQTVVQDASEAGDLHPKDHNSAIAAAVLAAWVVATS